MIKITFAEPETTDWKAWLNACRSATKKVIRTAALGAKPKITDHYKDDRMKHVYVSDAAPFFGKCVYCESRIFSDQPGDVEHFRPAKRVTEMDHSEVMIETEDGETVPHPGYYWLAYDWRNLLIACADCNRPNSFKTTRLVGKWDKFPIHGKRALRQGEEDNEEPLLLNPMWDDPEEHLKIDEIGILHEKNYSERGKTSIEVLGLNLREGLVTDRRNAMESATNSFQLWIIAKATHNEKDVDKHKQKLHSINKGSVPFAMAARFAVRQLASPFAKEISQFSSECQSNGERE